MSEHTTHATKYISVFVGLLVLTAITVGLSYMHFSAVMAVVVALVVASVKGGLVASYFMHLIGENKWIYLVLLFTVFFFLVLLALPTLVSISDYRL